MDLEDMRKPAPQQSEAADLSKSLSQGQFREDPSIISGSRYRQAQKGCSSNLTGSGNPANRTRTPIL